MEVQVIEEKENRFFKRKELILLLKHENSATPSKAELIKMLATSNSVSEDQIEIDYIFTKKGISESFAKAKILQEKPLKKEEKKEGEKIEAQTSQGT